MGFIKGMAAFLIVAFILLAALNAAYPPDPEYGKRLLEKIQASCRKEYSPNESAVMDCQIRLARKALIDDVARRQDRAASGAGL